MPGGPSNVETNDILREPKKRAPTLSGVHRFSMKREGRLQLAGATISELSAAIRAMSSRAREDVELSADEVHFVPFPLFAKLTGLDMMSGEEELPAGAYTVSLADTSLAAIFGRIFDHRSTGTLVIVVPRGERKLRTEIQVVQGKPTHVASSEPSLEMPAQLIRWRLLDGEDMRAAVHTSVLVGRPFLNLVAGRLGIQLGKLTMRFAAERLELLANQRSGVYAFSNAAPSHTLPIADSLLSFLPSLYRRGTSVQRLRDSIEPYLDMSFVRTARFETYLAALPFTHVERYAIASFGETETLGDAIAAIDDERFALSTAHLFAELGMIKPV
jgi:hypothetical protein